MGAWTPALKRFARRVGEFVVRKPALALIIAVGTGALSVIAMQGLRFDTSFAALLPDDDPTVKEVNDLKERAGGTVDLIIAVGWNEGHTKKPETADSKTAASERCAHALC